MRIHQLRPIHKSRRRKRVGRGGKRGTYSGKGIKGQRARAGKRIRPALRDLVKKIPKLRGIGFKKPRKIMATLNIERLNKNFEDNERVSPRSLFEKRLVGKIKGRLPEVKLLGMGDLEKKLLVENCQLSKSAKEKIEKAGGTIK